MGINKSMRCCKVTYEMNLIGKRNMIFRAIKKFFKKARTRRLYYRGENPLNIKSAGTAFILKIKNEKKVDWYLFESLFVRFIVLSSLINAL